MNIKNRVNSNRADANSVSQILWIAIAVAVISVVGLAIFNATKTKGNEVSGRIRNSKCYFQEGLPCSYFSTDYGDDNIQYGYKPYK